eukprot:TRINITY_DN16744_c0_g1_i1.p2 TRINITY_DN16744_c0_g1~~TRINITY_DN16744_c0_g1_i1.p2  ORF type:complete len:123 (+),score=14.51 TRINITY_DN16744_c0_g1_i1:45-371(+)
MCRDFSKHTNALKVLFDTMHAAEKVSEIKLESKEELAYVIGKAFGISVKKPTNNFSQLDVARTVITDLKQNHKVFGDPEPQALAECDFKNQSFIGWLSQVVCLLEAKM